MSTAKVCPDCAGTIYIADKYDTVSKVRIQGKSCGCLPGNTTKNWPEDCQSMHDRINDLEKWMSIIFESVPSSQMLESDPPKHQVDSMFLDLVPSTRFVDCVRNEVIDRARQNGIENSAAHTVWLRLCIYCGDVSKDHTQVKNAPDDPDVEIGNNKMCWRCEQIKNDQPMIFEWMTRIVQWRFKVDAWTPFKPAFEQTRVDPPPPPVPEPPKSIIV